MNSPKLNRRMYYVIIFLGIFAAGIILHFGNIMLSADPPQPATITAEVERGPILDRNGRLLAIQSELPTVTVWNPDVEDREKLAGTLAQILDIPVEEILPRLSIPDRDIIIKRTISPEEAGIIELLKQQGELRGVTLRRGFGRIYPESTTASHVIGFTGVDNIGLEGIEFTMENILNPPPEPDADSGGRRRNYGNQVFLTIDIVLQHAVEDIAEKLMEEHNPDSVMVLISEAKTGEILTFAVKPDFDPNNFADYDDNSRRNRPVQMTYEPGSVFKAFSLAAIMQLGGISDSSRFNTSGGYTNPQIGIPINELGGANYGIIGARGTIRFSSNVGAAFASDTVNERDFYQMLRQFGFGQITGITLNGEERGLLAPLTRWSRRSKPTIAIGQEIGVTAIQIMQAASALTNGGIMLKPRIIKRIVRSSGELIEEYGAEEVRRVLRTDVAAQMLDYMRSASIDGGTGRRVFIDGTDISVKTGTGEVFDPELRAYSRELFIASTLAILPTDDPEIIIYLVIQHPRGASNLGGVIATPAVREIASFLIPYLQIGTQADIFGLPKTLEIDEPMVPEITSAVPDFSGLPLSTLISLYAREDIAVQIYGSGWVRRQTPPPGSPYREGMLIELFLESGP